MEATMKIENRQKLLVVLTIAVVALFLADRLVFEPLAGWWKTRQTRIAQLRQQVAGGKLLIQREAALRAHWDQMRTNTLPANPSVAEQQVLKAFDGWAQESGVSINGITPQWKSDSDQDYATLDCRVEAAGALGTLTRFLYDVEKDPMALRLESLDLSAHDDAGQQLTLDLQVSGLALKSQAK
jgi:Tfp pilus assembly protein PilO